MHYESFYIKTDRTRHEAMTMYRTAFVIIFCIVLALLLLLLSSSANAASSPKPKHMKLLAVSELEGKLLGLSADLYLEIQPGTGRVFIETYPLSKLDTQISTRFAKEIACNYIDADCEGYDFFYTIKADSAIVGGPSAGAAVSILTIAALKDLPINESIAITGTINSGGIIGPVGGLKEKVDAAANAEISKILVPEGERFVDATPYIVVNESLIVELVDSNKTIDLSEYAARTNMLVVEVSDLNEAVYEFTGMKLKEESKELIIDPKYKEIMNSIATELCNRSKALELNMSKITFSNAVIRTYYADALNLSKKADAAILEKDYYSAASYCFGANVKYRAAELSLKSGNLSRNELICMINSVHADINNSEQIISNKSINTLTDLQALIITRERLRESDQYLKRVESELLADSIGSDVSAIPTGTTSRTPSDEGVFSLAYATERVYTVSSWSMFFGQEGIKLALDEQSLKNGCMKKISEAEERHEYLSLIFPFYTKSTKELLSQAYNDYSRKDYSLCLYRASIAKAESSVVLSVLGVQENQIDRIIDAKLRIIRNKIADEQKKGRFPIMGYSYYEYASNLKEMDKFSSLLYSEYAIEMSSLDMYFKKKNDSTNFSTNLFRLQQSDIMLLLTGILIGLLIGLVLWRRKTISSKSVKYSKHNKK